MLSITATTNTTATVSWQPPEDANGNVTDYTVEILIDAQLEVSRSFSSSQSEYTVSDLVPFTNYSVRVFANTSAGAGDNSEEQFSTNIGSELFFRL